MGRKRRGIPGLSFSWKRATGISSMKGKIARATGIPTTRAGRQRKAGKAMGCLLPLLLLTLLSTLGFTYQSKAARYEYKVEYFGTISEKKLNELGAEGWELTAVTTSGGGAGQFSSFYFKRVTR